MSKVITKNECTVIYFRATAKGYAANLCPIRVKLQGHNNGEFWSSGIQFIQMKKACVKCILPWHLFGHRDVVWPTILQKVKIGNVAMCSNRPGIGLLMRPKQWYAAGLRSWLVPRNDVARHQIQGHAIQTIRFRERTRDFEPPVASWSLLCQLKVVSISWSYREESCRQGISRRSGALQYQVVKLIRYAFSAIWCHHYLQVLEIVTIEKTLSQKTLEKKIALCFCKDQ